MIAAKAVVSGRHQLKRDVLSAVLIPAKGYDPYDLASLTHPSKLYGYIGRHVA